MILKILSDFLGSILIITSIFDALKYIWQANAIKKAGIAQGHSRKGIIVAIINDLVKLLYGLSILNWYIVISSIFALYTMIYNFYVLYLYYPYNNRASLSFKRPGIFIYIYNSFLSEKTRPHL